MGRSISDKKRGGLSFYGGNRGGRHSCYCRNLYDGSLIKRDMGGPFIYTMHIVSMRGKIYEGGLPAEKRIRISCAVIFRVVVSTGSTLANSVANYSCRNISYIKCMPFVFYFPLNTRYRYYSFLLEQCLIQITL